MRAALMQDLAREMGGECRGEAVAITGAAIDSRQLQPGDLFVALPGSRVDGHDYVAAAAEAGAVAAMVTRFVDAPIPQWRVGDPRRALIELACRARAESGAVVVGVTGSNGKTTVKEMLASILRRVGPTRATAGNLNNELGVPLTLCRLAPEDRFAVVEMGCGRPGDITLLASWARPAVGLVNNVGPAHLGGFGSLEAIARCKGELFAALPDDGHAVINADDAFAQTWEQQAAHCHILRFSLAERPAEVSGMRDAAGRLVIELPDQAPITVDLPLPGRHNRANALAAAAAAHAAGANAQAIGDGLEQVQPVPGRLVRRPGRAGSVIIDDSYNANPASLAAALQAAGEEADRLWLVLGDMAELGPEAAAYHAEAGRLARDCGVERVYGLGPLSAEAVAAFGPAAGARAFSDRTALRDALRAELAPGVQVLVKGSRAAGMEQVVAGLLADSSVEGSACC